VKPWLLLRPDKVIEYTPFSATLLLSQNHDQIVPFRLDSSLPRTSDVLDVDPTSARV